MASRRKARILAVQALYAWDMSGQALSDLLSFEWLDEEKKEHYESEILDFAKLMIAGTIEKIDVVDTMIRRHLQHWSFERLRKVDLAILRVGAYSILYQDDIPPQISIDEAIEIAKEYSGEDSFRFINGVLDGIRKDNVEVFHDTSKK
ncbi:MAG TPA: transcription antitermination factor NusB [Spirochaetaceae bacterium]|nr:transcription antitermination factor NusB [Spirochaetaceae bacterium]